MKHSPTPPFPIAVGDTVRVIVVKGHGEKRREFPPVPCRILSILHNGRGEISVQLLTKACIGWEAGDTYRTYRRWLRPPIALNFSANEKPQYLIDKAKSNGILPS